MGYVEPGSIRLRDFLKDSLAKTGDQIRESTRKEYKSAMNDFIKAIGNIDYQSVTLEHGEFYRQACLDKGNKPATVQKKLREIKTIFETAVKRRQLDENPLEYIKMPKYSQNNINTYSDRECERILRAAQDYTKEWNEQTTLKSGHSDFRTTHKFYLAVAHDLKERVRQANARGLFQKLVQIGATSVLACKSG